MLHHARVIYYHIHAKSTHAFSGKCEIEVLMAFASCYYIYCSYTCLLLKLAFAMPNLASDLWCCLLLQLAAMVAQALLHSMRLEKTKLFTAKPHEFVNNRQN